MIKICLSIVVCIFTCSLTNWSNIFETYKVEQTFINPKIKKLQYMRDYLKEYGKTVDFNGEVYSVYLENGLHYVFKVTRDDIHGD